MNIQKAKPAMVFSNAGDFEITTSVDENKIYTVKLDGKHMSQDISAVFKGPIIIVVKMLRNFFGGAIAHDSEGFPYIAKEISLLEAKKLIKGEYN